MYEEPNLRIIFFVKEDVVRTSDEWKDENVDNNGWT